MENHKIFGNENSFCENKEPIIPKIKRDINAIMKNGNLILFFKTTKDCANTPTKNIKGNKILSSIQIKRIKVIKPSFYHLSL